MRIVLTASNDLVVISWVKSKIVVRICQLSIAKAGVTVKVSLFRDTVDWPGSWNRMVTSSYKKRRSKV